MAEAHRRGLIAALLVGVVFVAPARADEAALADAIWQADRTGRVTPRVSVLEPDIDLDGAYRVQRILVDRRITAGDGIAGYKNGLTGTLAKMWFGIDEPVFGVIPKSGLRRSGDAIVTPPGRRMLLETEIGLVAGARIDKPVADVAALKKLIRSVVPVVEIPAGGFREADARKLTVTDIVANNVSAAFLVAGTEIPVEGLVLKSVSATLSRDGKMLSDGTGADTMGDPWRAALWLVNVAVKRGRVVEPGHILSTGVLGKRIESAPGAYLAEFGPLGRIELTIR